jgi:phosphatidylglycerophosphate synthase
MEKAKATGIKKYLPNIATFTRLFGSFSLLFLTNIKGKEGLFKDVPWVWLIVYIFLVLTDAIDGVVARKLNAKSDFGAHIDALSDTTLLVIGASIVFVKFADKLPSIEKWIYIGVVIFCACDNIIMNYFSKKYFGTSNMLHSYPQKAFAAGCYIGVGFWAFLRDVPWWSIAILVLINLWGAIDGIVYCVRAAAYDVNFKGHGFQKYEKRKK